MNCAINLSHTPTTKGRVKGMCNELMNKKQSYVTQKINTCSNFLSNKQRNERQFGKSDADSLKNRLVTGTQWNQG